MNRNSLVVALAALIIGVVCLSGLTGCGGGGGSSPESIPVVPPSTNPSGGTTGGTGTPTGGGTDPGTGNTIPGCTRKLVNVALVGDETMLDYYFSGRLQVLLDAKFKQGNTMVNNYAVAYTGTGNSPYITGDVLIEDYGLNDMINGVDPAVYQKAVTSNTHATLLVTQIATGSEIYTDTPYVAAVLAAGADKGLPVADVNAWMNNQVQTTGLPVGTMFSSNYDLKPEIAEAIIDQVIFPEVEKQVAPLLCVAP